MHPESCTYHSSFKYETGYGNKHVYDFGENPTFDETELNSIMLMDIIDTYAISREATRELVYFIRTVLQNNLKDAKLNNGKLM